MSSRVTDIYAAIESMSVDVGTKTPTTYGLTGLPNKVETGTLPARLLEIFGRQSEAKNVTHRTLGPTPHMNVNWVISDLLLLTPQAQGQGVRQYALDLVQYCGRYIDLIQVNEALISNASIVGLDVNAGLYEYPLNSGLFYFGALAVNHIQELHV